jgi:ketosteroid isomerase-like protein
VSRQLGAWRTHVLACTDLFVAEHVFRSYILDTQSRSERFSRKQNDTSTVKRADAYLQGVVDGDVPALAAMFDDDAILMLPNQPFLRGKLSIRHFYEDWCHSPMRPTAFTFDHLDATVLGDSAYAWGLTR